MTDEEANFIDLVNSWYSYDLKNQVKGLDDIVAMGEWCEQRFGKESNENGWYLGSHFGIVASFKTKEMFTEFVMVWG